MSTSPVKSLFLPYDKDGARMLRLREVAMLLGLHPNTVRAWADKGLIKAYRIGRRGDRRFRLDEVMGLLSEAEHEALV